MKSALHVADGTHFPAGFSQAEAGAAGMCRLTDSQYFGARQSGLPVFCPDAEERLEPEFDS